MNKQLKIIITLMSINLEEIIVRDCLKRAGYDDDNIEARINALKNDDKSGARFRNSIIKEIVVVMKTQDGVKWNVNMILSKITGLPQSYINMISKLPSW